MKKLFKKLSISIILPVVQNFITFAVPTSVVATSMSESVKALTIEEIFEFAKSKGHIKERTNISEYNTLVNYDKNKEIEDKKINKICEETKVSKIIEFINNNDKNFDETSLKCIGVFLDRISHGLGKIRYENGIEEMLAYINKNKNNIYKYNRGLQYIRGFLVQEMLYNIANWNMCWSFEQNYNDAVEKFIDFFGQHVIHRSANDMYLRKEIFQSKAVKNLLFVIFSGNGKQPISELECVVHDTKIQVMSKYYDRYASLNYIVPPTSVNDFTTSNSTVILRNPKSLWRQTIDYNLGLLELKKYLYEFERNTLGAKTKDFRSRTSKNSIFEKDLALTEEIGYRATLISNIKMKEQQVFGIDYKLIDFHNIMTRINHMFDKTSPKIDLNVDYEQLVFYAKKQDAIRYIEKNNKRVANELTQIFGYAPSHWYQSPGKLKIDFHFNLEFLPNMTTQSELQDCFDAIHLYSAHVYDKKFLASNPGCLGSIKLHSTMKSQLSQAKDDLFMKI